jgi:lipopolysaccharide transport system ATP-binding protein
MHPVEINSVGKFGGTGNALRVAGVGKVYRVWKSPAARLWHSLGRLGGGLLPLTLNRNAPHSSDVYHDFPALEGITFDLPRGTAMAVIGRNGSGKSTLLQIIAGTLQPTTGIVERHGKIAALLELGSGFNPEFTGRENVFLNGILLGLDQDEISERFHEVEAFAGIGEHIHQPVKTYSSGMLMRLAFSVQILVEPEILIIDEALAVGDIFFQQKCYDRMQKLADRGTSILFVSHDLVSVSNLTQVAMVLHKGRCAFMGSSSRAIKEYQMLELEPRRSREKVQSAKAELNGVPTPGAISTVSFSPSAAIDTNTMLQIGKENAEFTNIAVYNANGDASRIFQQGDLMHVYCEIKVHRTFECISVGVSMKDKTNLFVHGKHTIQHGVRPPLLSDGESIAFELVFQLDLAVGEYSLDSGIIDIDRSVESGLSSVAMEASLERLCFNHGFFSFHVTPRHEYKYFQLPFYGVADLQGKCRVVSLVDDNAQVIR